MPKNLDPLGYARVFRDPESGELVVDTDTIREDLAGDDFGEDDFGDDVGDDVGDDFGDDVGDEVGARGRGKRRRRARKSARRERRDDRKEDRDMEKAEKRGDTIWGMTAVGGIDSRQVIGAASVKVRLQHDLRAHDITFTGSTPGARVTSIFFGDQAVWSASDGIDVAVFGSNSFLRGLLKGQSIKAGLDITVNGFLTTPGDFAVTIIGEKPVHRTC